MIIGYTTGVYDLFHVGHLHILERASQNCDQLIVGVSTDELSEERKKKRPIVPFAERVEISSAIRGVDRVVAQNSMDKFAAWKEHRFDRMFVGDDWKGTPTWLELDRKFAELNVEIVYFPYTKHTSSTRLAAALESLR